MRTQLISCRKLVLCALGMSDIQHAKEVYLEMSDTNKKHPSTQYLLYKIALRCQDIELGICIILTRLYMDLFGKQPSVSIQFAVHLPRMRRCYTPAFWKLSVLVIVLKVLPPCRECSTNMTMVPPAASTFQLCYGTTS